MRSTIFYLLLSSIFVSCYYDKEEEIYPEVLVYVDLDTVVVSYAADIEPIINNECYSCHSGNNAQAGVKLDGYTNFSSYALKPNSNLLAVIKHQPGFSPMPQPLGKLSNRSINMIEKWINDGAINN